ncbi:hypothetical protein CEV34_3918 [Brucella pseudogrignonensis]|uniref:Uncharacterized protein n=1 Tax=Brucella pseudogrignonensis TaxID=419475 RepID=A0A256G7U5_9HYPH|nr:hypothetical protein CEV34_3918 [Brucella pseudogrignonensis]
MFAAMSATKLLKYAGTIPLITQRPRNDKGPRSECCAGLSKMML